VQVVDVAFAAAGIDEGSATLNLSALLRSWGGLDRPSFYAVFRDEVGNELDRSPVQGSVSSVWTEHSIVQAVPVSTRSIEVVLIGTRNSGSDNDSYFDEIAASLSFVPSPARPNHLCGALSARLAGDRAVEPVVSEGAVGVEAIGERYELVPSGIAVTSDSGAASEDLAPVGPGVIRSQRGFDSVDRFPDRGVIVEPGEVEGDRVTLMVRTHPQLVTSHRADFGHHQCWGNRRPASA